MNDRDDYAYDDCGDNDCWLRWCMVTMMYGNYIQGDVTVTITMLKKQNFLFSILIFFSYVFLWRRIYAPNIFSLCLAHCDVSNWNVIEVSSVAETVTRTNASNNLLCNGIVFKRLSLSSIIPKTDIDCTSSVPLTAWDFYHSTKLLNVVCCVSSVEILIEI